MTSEHVRIEITRPIRTTQSGRKAIVLTVRGDNWSLLNDNADAIFQVHGDLYRFDGFGESFHESKSCLMCYCYLVPVKE